MLSKAPLQKGEGEEKVTTKSLNRDLGAKVRADGSSKSSISGDKVTGAAMKYALLL